MDKGVGGEFWMEDAACAKADLANTDFFPYPGSYTGAARAALKICAGCPVRDECLEFALKTHQRGIWGGVTERYRDKNRRKLLKEAQARMGR